MDPFFLVGLMSAGFVVALVATFGCEWLARRARVVKAPRADRWHQREMPLLGGAALIVGTFVPLLWMPGLGSRFGVLLLASGAIGLVGLYDDLKPMGAPAKFLAQILLAGVLIHFGILLRLTPYPVLDVFLTLLWMVGITNAFNLLDNMDGLAAGMAAIAAAFRLLFFVIDQDLQAATITAPFLGAALGFLVRNFPPAKIFMGDSGSLFLGFFLAGVCLVGHYPYSRGISAVLVLPLLLMLIPIFDTTFVTLTRLLRGQAISQGGRDHTSHRIVALGVSERKAVVFLYSIAGLSGSLALMSYHSGFNQMLAALALLTLGLFLLGVHLSRVEIVSKPPALLSSISVVADFPFKRHVATALIDLVVVVVAYYFAYVLRFENAIDSYNDTFMVTVGPVIIIQLSALAAFGSYRGLWRYTSLSGIIKLVQGLTVGVVITAVYVGFTETPTDVSWTLFVLDWLLLVVLICGTRASFRVFGELLASSSQTNFDNVLIYGAGDGGEMMLRELKNNPALRRRPIGFLDDDRAKAGTRIHEVPVLGSLDNCEEILGRFSIREVIVSSRAISDERISRLEQVCAHKDVTLSRGGWLISQRPSELGRPAGSLF